MPQQYSRYALMILFPFVVSAYSSRDVEMHAFHFLMSYDLMFSSLILSAVTQTFKKYKEAHIAACNLLDWGSLI